MAHARAPSFGPRLGYAFPPLRPLCPLPPPPDLETNTPKVRLATKKGLVQYQLAPSPADRPHPALWPKLTLSIDQESSGVCATVYMERQLGLNIEKCWDLSHSVWRDTIMSLKMCDLWTTTILCLIAYNLPSGPWSSDARYHEVRQGMRHLHRTSSPYDNALFMSQLPGLIDEMKREDLLNHPRPTEALWDAVFETAPWEVKGSKCVLNRFFGVRRRAKEETARWKQRAFAYQFLCIEQGFFRGARFQQLAMRDDVGAGQPGSSTSARRTSEHERTLRSACANCAVIAALVYGNDDNAFRQRVFWVTSQPLDTWHGLQSSSCRSVWETRRLCVGCVLRGLV